MDSRKKIISRRTILKALLACSLIVALATGLGLRYRRLLKRRYLRLRPDKTSGRGTLAKAEFEVIGALFDVVSSNPAPSTADLLDYVNVRTSTVKGLFREYKEGVALLEARARKRFGHRFASLEKISREAVLREVLTPQFSMVPARKARSLLHKLQLGVQLIFFRDEAHFYRFVFLDLLRFYWSSNAGWAAVGYHSYPGAPDDPRAYTSRPVGERVVWS